MTEELPTFPCEEPNHVQHRHTVICCEKCKTDFGTYNRNRKWCPACLPGVVEERNRRSARTAMKRRAAVKAQVMARATMALSGGGG